MDEQKEVTHEHENINHAEMVAVLAKDGKTIMLDMTHDQMHNLHMAVGISGGVAKLLNPLLNWVNSIGEADIENITEELGGVEFYLEGLRQGLNIDRATPYNATYVDEGNMGFATMRLVIDAGLIIDQVMKSTIHQKELDIKLLTETLSKFEVWLHAVRVTFDLTYEQVLQANIDKLAKRYPGFKYTNEAAHERADKEGES